MIIHLSILMGQTMSSQYRTWCNQLVDRVAVSFKTFEANCKDCLAELDAHEVVERLNYPDWKDS